MVKTPNECIYIYIFIYCIYKMMIRSQYFPTCCSHFVCWNSLASPLASKTLNFQVCSIWNSWNADNPSAPPNEVEQFLPDCYICLYVYIQYIISFALLTHDKSICHSWRSITSLKILMTMWHWYKYVIKWIEMISIHNLFMKIWLWINTY